MNNLEANLREMRDEDLNSQLTDLIDNIDYERNKFMPKLQGLHKKFYESDGETPLEKYCLNYQTSPYYHYKEGETQKDLQGKYVLDLIPALGKYDEQTEEWSGLISGWNTEITSVDNVAGPALGEAQRSFDSMLEVK